MEAPGVLEAKTPLAGLFATTGEEMRLVPPPPRRDSTRTMAMPGRSSAAKGRSRRWSGFERVLNAGVKVSLLSLIVWGLLFNFSEVRGSSMRPGIHDRDRILVDNLSYWLGAVERGDIVVLRYPLDPSLDYIKRVVGLPGEEVRIEGGRLWIDGTLIEEPYVAPDCFDPFTHLVTRVKEDHFFVLGDNRLRSSDSREFGQVPRSNIRGKVRLRLWPLDRIGWIH